MRQIARLTVIATTVMTCAVIAPVLLNFSSLYARVYDDRRFPALSRYALEPTPDIALVGSSMTARLYEGYFKTRLRNISTSGGSPLTGLAILASYPSLPRVVLVETNMMSGQPNLSWSRNSARTAPLHSSGFAPIGPRFLLSIIGSNINQRVSPNSGIPPR
jgi:hypothetical protein